MTTALRFLRLLQALAHRLVQAHHQAVVVCYRLQASRALEVPLDLEIRLDAIVDECDDEATLRLGSPQTQGRDRDHAHLENDGIHGPLFESPEDRALIVGRDRISLKPSDRLISTELFYR